MVVIGAATFELLLTVGVRALVLILAEALIAKVIAKFGLIIRFDLVLGMAELTCVTLTTLVLEEVSADTLSLQSEELLHFGLVADVYGVWNLS